MDSKDPSAIALALNKQAETGASANQIADAVVRLWQQIDAVLVPIVGNRGVAALYKRSLFTAARTHHWLPSSPAELSSSADLPALQSALAERPSTEAALAGAHLLQNFHALLSDLIGPSLTERLLRSVWSNFLKSMDAQEIPT